VRLVRATSAAACAICLVACGTAPQPTDRAATWAGSHPSTGTVTGFVRLYGGAIDPATRKSTLNGAPGRGVQVSLRAGSFVAWTTSDHTGRFAFHVAPGWYTLGCSLAKAIHIVSGATTSVDCTLPVP